MEMLFLLASLLIGAAKALAMGFGFVVGAGLAVKLLLPRR